MKGESSDLPSVFWNRDGFKKVRRAWWMPPSKMDVEYVMVSFSSVLLRNYDCHSKGVSSPDRSMSSTRIS